MALQRGVEALVSRRNLGRLLARGGIRPPRDLTTSLVLFHVLWFASLLAERELLGARVPPPPLVWALAAAFVTIEATRAWIFATLRSRWTIQVVVIPDEAPVARGPYRLLAHPNYVVVASEVAVVSTLVGAWRTALVAFPVVVALLLARIRREESAWREVASRALR